MIAIVQCIYMVANCWILIQILRNVIAGGALIMIHPWLMQWYHTDRVQCHNLQQWASYQIRKIAGCACAGNAGNVFRHCRLQRKPLVSDPDMHHGTCVTHVPWCMSGKRCRHSRRMRNPQFYVSIKRPMMTQFIDAYMHHQAPSS